MTFKGVKNWGLNLQSGFSTKRYTKKEKIPFGKSKKWHKKVPNKVKEDHNYVVSFFVNSEKYPKSQIEPVKKVLKNKRYTLKNFMYLKVEKRYTTLRYPF